MRYSLDAEQWARVRAYVQQRTREQMEDDPIIGLTLARVADGKRRKWGSVQSLAPELVNEALKWSKQ